MNVNFAQNWPVFILLGAFITFVLYVVIHSRRQEKIDKEKNKTQNKS